MRLHRLLAGLLTCAVIALSALAAPPQFDEVVPGRALTFPHDFGAHPGYRTEWWYVTGWLQTSDGKPLGFQVTFFRSATEHDAAAPSRFAPKQLVIAHAALSDPAVGRLLRVRVIKREGGGDWKGRVEWLVLEGTKANLTISGDEFRSRFGLKSTWFRL